VFPVKIELTIVALALSVAKKKSLEDCTQGNKKRREQGRVETRTALNENGAASNSGIIFYEGAIVNRQQTSSDVDRSAQIPLVVFEYAILNR